MSESAATPGKSKRLRRADVVKPAIVWSSEAAAILQAARNRSGISQRKLGQLVGVSASVINFYEAAQQSPSPSTMQRMADALGLAWYQPPVIVLLIEDAKTLCNSFLGQMNRQWPLDEVSRGVRAWTSRQSAAADAAQTTHSTPPINAPAA